MKNKTPGDGQRKGAVKTRSQAPNPITGSWTKRDERSGKFLTVTADPRPFSGVRKTKKVEAEAVPEVVMTACANCRQPQASHPVSPELGCPAFVPDIIGERS